MFSDFRGKFLVVMGVAILAGLTLSACGGGSSTLAQAEREQAAKHGRVEAQERAKELRLEQKLAKLERENRAAKKRHRAKERDELKRQQAHVPPPSTSEPTSAPSSSTPSGTDCGGGTIAGPETSCGFALNVRAEYESFIGSGSGTVEAFSEANEEIYDMYCTVGTYHECSGAISATVYWP